MFGRVLNTSLSLLPDIALAQSKRGCVCDNWKPSYLHRLIFNRCTFSRRVTVLSSRGCEKIKCRPFRTREIGDVRLQEELCKTEQKNITLCGKNIPAFLVHHFFNRPFTSNINILTTEIVARMCTIKKIF